MHAVDRFGNLLPTSENIHWAVLDGPIEIGTVSVTPGHPDSYANVQVHFCDPRSPWQRGSNENTNGLLRQYFPKGVDVSNITQRQLDAVANKLNTRPRQTLEWKTPAQVLAAAVALTG